MTAPSSTSSSRAPDAPWRAIWLATAIVLLAAVIVCEVALRGLGFSPSVRDTATVWSFERRRATSEDALVLLGDSRMQLGVDPAVLSEQLGRPVIQLSINSANPMPILEDLAQDEGFTGEVWVSTRAENLFGRPWGAAEEYVAKYEDSGDNPNVVVNTGSAIWLDAHLAVRNAAAAVRQILGAGQSTSYIVMRPDRYRPADYSIVDVDRHRTRVVARTRERYEYPQTARPTTEAFDDSLAVLDDRIRRIQSRNGKVVLIRMPTGPTLWALSDSVFPRDRYWDRMVERTAATGVNFRDHAALSSWVLPDESHLDQRDGAAFSTALANVVIEATR